LEHPPFSSGIGPIRVSELERKRRLLTGQTLSLCLKKKRRWGGANGRGKVNIFGEGAKEKGERGPS